MWLWWYCRGPRWGLLRMSVVVVGLGGHDRGFSGGQLQVGVGVVGRHDAIINL